MVTLTFAADDGNIEGRLWKSDGTENGTHAVGTGYGNMKYLTAVGNTLYFQANGGGTHGIELWKSDGTEDGTVMVKDIVSGNRHSYPAQFTAVGNVVYFLAYDPDIGGELWRTDGTEDGTYMVKQINEGGIGSNPGHNII